MIKKLLFLVGFIVLLCFSCRIIFAEEMHPIWDYKNILFFERPTGELGFRFRGESRQSSYDGANGESRHRFFTEELKIEDTMFVFRPRFLKINFGFGVVFEQGGADYPSRGFLTDYKVQGDFLTGTPYSGFFFAEKQQKEYEHTPSSIYLMDMFRAGTGFRMGEEVMGWPINFNFKYSSRESSRMFNEFDSFFKESQTTFEIDTKKEWDIFELNLRSGITQYEREFISDNKDYNAESLNSYFSGSLFGKFFDDGLRTKTRISVNSRSGINECLNLKFGQDVNYWILQDKLQTLDAFLRFDAERISRDYGNISDEERSEFFQKEENFTEIRLGVVHTLGESLSSELEGVLSKLSLSDYESLSSGIRGKTDYTKAIPWKGKFSSGYAFEFNDITRSGDSESFIKGESHALLGYSSAALRYENVQIESIEVFDLSGEVHYLEGIDYRVYRAGPKTYIERIPGTSILNGESVFVDYKNRNPLGDIIESSHTVSLGISLLDGLIEPYVRLFILNQEVNGPLGSIGEYDNMFLNPGASYTAGIRSRNIFQRWWNIERESNIELEENTQELYPFQRFTFKSSLSVPLPFAEGLKLSLSNNKTLIDYRKKSDRDYSLLSNTFSVLYETRKIRVASGISHDISDIGNTERKVLSAHTGVSYKLRRWTIDLFARQTFEEYGTSERLTEHEGLLIKFYISRKF